MDMACAFIEQLVGKEHAGRVKAFAEYTWVAGGFVNELNGLLNQWSANSSAKQDDDPWAKVYGL
jgi:hypothetical protein